MEYWKPVTDFEGLYEVSSMGRVRRVGGKVLKLHLRTRYMFIALHDKKRTRTVDVHRLVAEHFCDGRSKDRCEVNHKNLNRLDNRADNLEWVTHTENVRHAFDNGAVANHVSKTAKKQVLCEELGRVFPSSYEAAAVLNAEFFHGTKDPSTMARNIRWCALGKKNSAYGFHWRDVHSEPSTTIPKGSTPKQVEMGDPA